MNTHATTTFAVKSWDEKPYNEAAGELKLTHASIAYTYQGDLEGESTLDYLMMYREDGSGNFFGLERVIGRLGGRAGSFVLQHSGTFNKLDVKTKCFVAPASWRVCAAKARSSCPAMPSVTR